MKRKFYACMAALLATLTLTGCTMRTGTVKWVDWTAYHKGSTQGTCRVGMTDIVTDKGKRLKFGETLRIPDITYRQCHRMYKKGERKTYE